MPYRANLGGQFGGGAGPAASHPIDISGAIDALTNGASTLIQNAYVRNQAKAALALRQQQQDLESQRYSETNAREIARDADAKAYRADQLKRQAEKDAADHEYRMGELEQRSRAEELKAKSLGITPGTTTIARQPDLAQPSVPPIAQAFSRGLSAAAPVPPTDLTTPVQQGSLGSVPRLNVTTTQDEYSAANDPRVAARVQAAAEARTSHAANRDYDVKHPLPARETTTGGAKSVTGTARLQHIMRAAQAYMKPKYLGGLGLDATAAQARATADVDAVIAHTAGATPASPTDTGGDIDLRDPATAGIAFPKGEHAAPVDPAVALAVQHIREKKGTLAQLEASKKSDAYKAAVRAALGTP